MFNRHTAGIPRSRALRKVAVTSISISRRRRPPPTHTHTRAHITFPGDKNREVRYSAKSKKDRRAAPIEQGKPYGSSTPETAAKVAEEHLRRERRWARGKKKKKI